VKSEGIRRVFFPGNKIPGAPHPRFPVGCRGFREPHAPFLKERRTRGFVQGCVQEIRGISLVFREMWDSTALAQRFFGARLKSSRKWDGCPSIAKAYVGQPMGRSPTIAFIESITNPVKASKQSPPCAPQPPQAPAACPTSSPATKDKPPAPANNAAAGPYVGSLSHK
jgi:hypothetical protein